MTARPQRFAPNIGNKGRRLRGSAAAVIIIVGLVGLSFSLIVGFMLLAGGAFVLFEALRGWCALRACGIKTKL